MLYKYINSSVSLPFGTSKRFNINQGIRQGDPTSPYLFIVITEFLAIYVKNSRVIRPSNVLGSQLLVSQLADDTTLFLSDVQQIPGAINQVSHSSKAYGLKLNFKKCELMVLHDISLFGRICIQKSESLSRLIYPAFFFVFLIFLDKRH